MTSKRSPGRGSARLSGSSASESGGKSHPGIAFAGPGRQRLDGRGGEVLEACIAWVRFVAPRPGRFSGREASARLAILPDCIRAPSAKIEGHDDHARPDRAVVDGNAPMASRAVTAAVDQPAAGRGAAAMARSGFARLSELVEALSMSCRRPAHKGGFAAHTSLRRSDSERASTDEAGADGDRRPVAGRLCLWLPRCRGAGTRRCPGAGRLDGRADRPARASVPSRPRLRPNPPPRIRPAHRRLCPAALIQA